MGLVIELAIDIQRNNGVTNIKTLLANLADHHNSSYHYFMHEIEGFLRSTNLKLSLILLCHSVVDNYRRG